jgi:hypothetical protein
MNVVWTDGCSVTLLRTSVISGNQRSGKMQAAFRVLIPHRHSPYNCQNYGNHSQGSRLVVRTLHWVNLPATPGQLTPITVFEDSRDFAETSFGTTYRNFGLSVTANCQLFIKREIFYDRKAIFLIKDNAKPAHNLCCFSSDMIHESHTNTTGFAHTLFCSFWGFWISLQQCLRDAYGDPLVLQPLPEDVDSYSNSKYLTISASCRIV